MFVVLLSFLLVCAYCTPFDDLNVARKMWEQFRLVPHSYEFKNGPCMCTDEAFKTKVVTIRENVVESIFIKDTQQPFDSSPGTVVDIFGAIEKALLAQKRVQVTYDEKTGFPLGDIQIDIDAFAYDGGIWWVTSNLQFLESTSVVCAADVMQCSDGSVVSRDPNNNCMFAACNTSESRVCIQDIKECPDGSFVSRDPENGCNFRACPSKVCVLDAKECPDGSYVGRDPQNNCEFSPCPNFPACTEEAIKCPDGTFISRDPDNNCEFPDCPALFCTMDAKICDDGSAVARSPSHGCEFELCPEDVLPYIIFHKKDIEMYLKAKIGFTEVEIVDMEDEDITLRVTSVPGSQYWEEFKEEFASVIGVRSSRVTISGLPQKESDKAMRVTVSVDYHSTASVVKASVMLVLLVVGWLWI